MLSHRALSLFIFFANLPHGKRKARRARRRKNQEEAEKLHGKMWKCVIGGSIVWNEKVYTQCRSKKKPEVDSESCNENVNGTVIHLCGQFKLFASGASHYVGEMRKIKRNQESERKEDFSFFFVCEKIQKDSTMRLKSQGCLSDKKKLFEFFIKKKKKTLNLQEVGENFKAFIMRHNAINVKLKKNLHQRDHRRSKMMMKNFFPTFHLEQGKKAKILSTFLLRN